MKHIKIRFVLYLIVLTCGSGLVAQEETKSGIDLTLTQNDIRIVYNEKYDGYDLFIRKKDGIKSVLLTESLVNPNKGSRTYAYRSPSYTPINGDERRVAAGRFIASKTGFYIADSNPQNDSEFGQSFRLLVPKEILYGFDSTERKGILNILDGTYVSLRTFSKKYADYSGEYLDNSFAFSSPLTGDQLPELIPYLQPGPLLGFSVKDDSVALAGLPEAYSDTIPRARPNIFSGRFPEDGRRPNTVQVYEDLLPSQVGVSDPLPVGKELPPAFARLIPQEPNTSALVPLTGAVALDPITGARLGETSDVREGLDPQSAFLRGAAGNVPRDSLTGNPLDSTNSPAENFSRFGETLNGAGERAQLVPLDNSRILPTTDSSSEFDNRTDKPLTSIDGRVTRDPFTGEILPQTGSLAIRDPLTGEILPQTGSLANRDPLTGEILPQTGSLANRDPEGGRGLPQFGGLAGANPGAGSPLPETTANSALIPPTGQALGQLNGKIIRDPVTGEILPQATSLANRDPLTGEILPQTGSLANRDPEEGRGLPQFSGLAGANPGTGSPLPETTANSALIPPTGQALDQLGENVASKALSDNTLPLSGGLANAVPGTGNQLSALDGTAVRDPLTGQYLPRTSSETIPDQFGSPSLPLEGGLAIATPGDGSEYPTQDAFASELPFPDQYLPSSENTQNSQLPLSPALQPRSDQIEQAIIDSQLATRQGNSVDQDPAEDPLSRLNSIATRVPVSDNPLQQIESSISPQYPGENPFSILNGEQNPIQNDEQRLFSTENPATSRSDGLEPFASSEGSGFASSPNINQKLPLSESGVSTRLVDPSKFSTTSDLNRDVPGQPPLDTNSADIDPIGSDYDAVVGLDGRRISYDPITGEALPSVGGSISSIDKDVLRETGEASGSPRINAGQVPPLDRSEEVLLNTANFQGNNLPSVDATVGQKTPDTANSKPPLASSQGEIDQQVLLKLNEAALPTASANAAIQDEFEDIQAGQPLPVQSQESAPAPIDFTTLSDGTDQQQTTGPTDTDLIPPVTKIPSGEPSSTTDDLVNPSPIEDRGFQSGLLPKIGGQELDRKNQDIAQNEFSQPRNEIRLFPKPSDSGLTDSETNIINPDDARSIPKSFPLDNSNVRPSVQDSSKFEPQIQQSSYNEPSRGRRNLFNLDERYLREAIEDYTSIGLASGQKIVLSGEEEDILTKIRDRLQYVDLSKTIDIAFVVDSTHSMWNDLPVIRQGLPPLLSSELDGARYRIAMVTFRDYGEDYVTQIQPFSNQVNEIQYRLNQIRAKGGGNKAEAVHEGIAAAVEQLTWISEERVIFLIGDAPGHSPPFPGVDLEVTLDLARDKGISIIPILLPNSE